MEKERTPESVTRSGDRGLVRARLRTVALFTQGRKVEALRRTPLFADLSKKEITLLARLSDDLEVDAGKVLCKEGQIGREFFVIVDGEVDVTRKGRPVKRSGGDDFFGEIALLEDIPRTATVTARTPLRLFVLTSRDFRHLVNASPSVERKIMRSLARRLLENCDDPALG
jgi:CRP/FNR family transcriptional regulator, cyclic AMP receptor protein